MLAAVTVLDSLVDLYFVPSSEAPWCVMFSPSTVGLSHTLLVFRESHFLVGVFLVHVLWLPA